MNAKGGTKVPGTTDRPSADFFDADAPEGTQVAMWIQAPLNDHGIRLLDEQAALAFDAPQAAITKTIHIDGEWLVLVYRKHDSDAA